MLKTDAKTLIKEAKEVKPESGARCGRITFGMSMVNNHNGKRITFTNGLYDKLGKPKNLQFLSLIQDDKRLLFVGEKLPNASASYTPTFNNKAIIYHAGLVLQLTSDFELSYEGITSLTFNSVEFEEIDEFTVAIISIPKGEPTVEN